MTTEPTGSSKPRAVPASGIGKIPRGFWLKILLTAVIFIPLIALVSVSLHRHQNPWRIVLRIPSLKPSPWAGGRGWYAGSWKLSTFSPDASKVLVSREYGAVEIWDVDTSQRLTVLEKGVASNGYRYVPCLSWSPDGELVAAWIVGPEYGHARLIVWQADDGQRLWEERAAFGYLPKDALMLGFSPDSTALAFNMPGRPREPGHLGFENHLRVAEAGDGRQLQEFVIGVNRGAVHWSPDGRFLAACSSLVLDLCDTQTEQRSRHLCPRQYANIYGSPERQEDWGVTGATHVDCAMMPDGETVIVSYRSGRAAWRAWARRRFQERGEPVPTRFQDEEDNLIPRPIITGRSRAYVLATGEMLWDRSVEGDIACADVSPNGKWIATLSDMRELCVRHMGTWDTEIEADLLEGPYSFANGLLWFPDNRRLLSEGSGGDWGIGLLVIDARTGKDLAFLPQVEAHHGSACASISSDGGRILTSAHDLRHVVWQRVRKERPYGILMRWELWTALALTVAMMWTMLVIARRTARRAGKRPLRRALTVCLFLWAACSAVAAVDHIAELATGRLRLEDVFSSDHILELTLVPAVAIFTIVLLLMLIHLRGRCRDFILVLLLPLVGLAFFLFARGCLFHPILSGGAWGRPVDLELFTRPLGMSAGTALIVITLGGGALIVCTFLLLVSSKPLGIDTRIARGYLT